MLRNAPHKVNVLENQEVGVDDWGNPVFAWVVVATVYGRFSVLTTEELVIGAYDTQNIDASIRVPNGTVTPLSARVQLVDPPDPTLAGYWLISAVRWNPDHKRLLVAKVTNP